MPRIYDIYMDSLRPLKFLTIILAILAGSTIVSYSWFEVKTKDLNFLTQVLPCWVWVSLFALYSVARAVEIFSSFRQWHVELFTSSLAIWLWSLVFVSSSIVLPMDSTCMYYFIPIIIEVWVLSRLIDYRKAI